MSSARLISMLLAASALAVVALTGPTTAPAAASVDPSDFVSQIDNKYLPFDPGTVFHYRGETDGTPSTVTTTVTSKHKVIEGVSTLVVHDVDGENGKTIEKTSDYYAQDKRGNVWYFGEDCLERDHGDWVRCDGSWQAGVDGAEPGIVMEADPQPGDTYQQENAPNAQDTAQVLTLDASVSVPFGSFNHALKTQETSPLDPGVVEDKYYVACVGEVKSVVVQGGDEKSKLVSIDHQSGRSNCNR
jgi:hypothetical protein